MAGSRRRAAAKPHGKLNIKKKSPAKIAKDTTPVGNGVRSRLRSRSVITGPSTMKLISEKPAAKQGKAKSERNRKSNSDKHKKRMDAELYNEGDQAVSVSDEEMQSTEQNRANRKRKLPLLASEPVPHKKLKVEQQAFGEGYVLTVGQGDVAQLGLGEDITEKKLPALVDLPSKVIDICAGGMHTLCLTNDNKLYTFGCNDEGALGRDTSEDGSEFFSGVVDIPGKVVRMSGGDSHSAALTEDGRLFIWGTFRDSSGAMGLLNSSIQKTPIQIMKSYPVAKVASGNDHLVMLTSDGQLFTCGCGEQGQLGRVAECFSSRGGRKGISLLLNPAPVVVRRVHGRIVQFDDIWTGAYSTFARAKGTGDIYICGLNNYNQLGFENNDNRFVLERSASFSTRSWKQIAGGQHHTLALDNTGKVYALGRHYYGCLGLGGDANSPDIKEPTLIPPLSHVTCVDIACNVATSYAVGDDGTAYAWGMGSSFALGTGRDEDEASPTAMAGRQLATRRAVAVTGGGQHAVILAADREVPAEDASENIAS